MQTLMKTLKQHSHGLILATALACILPLHAQAATKLLYWSMWNDAEPQAKALKIIMARYTKAHPETTFQVVWNGRQNQTKVRGAIAAGKQPDFIDQDSDQLVGGLIKEGQALSLDAALDSKAYGENRRFREIFMNGTVDLFSSGGKHYHLPYIYNIVSFWYNKDLMAEAKTTVPTTWDELLAVCKKVSATGNSALVVEGNVGFYNAQYFSYLVERISGSGALLKAVEDKSGAGWKDPAILRAAQMERQLWEQSCISADARGFQYPAGQQTIAMGESMGALVGSWLPTELADSAGKDFAWGSFPFPTVSGGRGKATDIQVAMLSFVVLKQAQHSVEAIDFLKFVLSEESQKTLSSMGNVGVTRQGVTWPGPLSSAYELAKQATAVSPLVGGLQARVPDFYTTVFEPLHNKLFLGQIKPEVFVETLTQKTQAYWKNR